MNERVACAIEYVAPWDDLWAAAALLPDGRHERLCKDFHKSGGAARKCARKHIRRGDHGPIFEDADLAKRIGPACPQVQGG